MKKLELGQTISIFANIGVIAGIVFLGFELSQNNELLAAQARYNLLLQRADMNDTLREPYVLEAIQEQMAGDEISLGQSFALTNVSVKLLEMWEWQFHEYQAGMLDRQQLPVENWKFWYDGELGVPLPIRELWELRGTASFSPEFVEFMEESVINR